MNNLLRIAKVLMCGLICVALAPTLAGSRVLAQGKGSVKGVVKDEKGKPLPDVNITLQMGDAPEIQLTTDKDGKFAKTGLPVGTYTISYTIHDVPKIERPLRIVDGKDTDATLDMNDKNVADYIKARKAEAEDEAKFGKLKAHFDAGAAALQQEQSAHDQLVKAPADQRPALQDKVDATAATAISEFKEALAVTAPTEVNNIAAINNSLGQASDLEGKYDEAAQYYTQSATAKPDAGVYNNMGIDLAKAGKLDDAKAAFEKSAQLDPAGAAKAFRNFGAVASNAGHMNDPAVMELLKKATDLDPKNAQGWYLYATVLVANMQTKQEGEKMTVILLPGTVEAYQKCIDVDPNGPYAEQARQGLDALKSMGVGIDTKVTAPKTKH